MAKGTVLKEFNHGYSICQWSTYPEGGGLVSPREFLECRLVERDDIKCTLFQTSPSVNDSIIRRAGIDVKPDPIAIRAETYPGNGFALEPLEAVEGDVNHPRNFKMTLVSCIELGGWLSTSLINFVTSQTLLDSNRRTKMYLEQRFKSSKD